MHSSGCGLSIRLEGASAEYNMPEALRLKGELDRGALERAINTIVERHESLRTHFVEVDGEPVQVIEPAVRIEIAGGGSEWVGERRGSGTRFYRSDETGSGRSRLIWDGDRCCG